MVASCSIGEAALRLGLAIVMGGLLGFEREYHRKAAGLRTHMMVALGAATFTLIALELFAQVSAAAGAGSAARVDPMRLIEGIIGGIGFLGAGAIIQGRDTVAGLTTAGSIWFVGSVGVAIGGGYYSIAALAVVAGLVVLAGMGLMERLLPRRSIDDDGSGP
jgi:putative Mg2+ transporter-C (MgtC) family protein